MALKYAVNNSLSAITSLPSGISGGALNLISTQTASSSASIEFSIDGTYDSYIFKFINIHPELDGGYFYVNFSTDGGSNYNVTKTTTAFKARHSEDDVTAVLQYVSSGDLAQGTGNQPIALDGVGNDSDESVSGYLHLFNPSSSTYVKHFIVNSNADIGNANCVTSFVAGYCNTTSPINAVRFIQQSGNLDDGIIKMYGVS